MGIILPLLYLGAGFGLAMLLPEHWGQSPERKRLRPADPLDYPHRHRLHRRHQPPRTLLHGSLHHGAHGASRTLLRLFH